VLLSELLCELLAVQRACIKLRKYYDEDSYQRLMQNDAHLSDLMNASGIASMFVEYGFEVQLSCSGKTRSMINITY
jgi:hypothetical protein